MAVSEEPWRPRHEPADRGHLPGEGPRRRQTRRRSFSTAPGCHAFWLPRVAELVAYVAAAGAVTTRDVLAWGRLRPRRWPNDLTRHVLAAAHPQVIESGGVWQTLERAGLAHKLVTAEPEDRGQVVKERYARWKRGRG